MRNFVVTGFVAANAERKISKNGKEYLTFRIGNTEFNDKDEQGNQKTYWFSVTTFNTRQFGMGQYLVKGKPVIVVGDYNDRIYQNRDGNCEISREIIANAIYFNSTGENSNNADGGNGQSKTTQKQMPTTQTTMTPKPTTDEIKVIEAPINTNEDNEDDLPF